LTDDHLHPTLSQKMRVCLATQILSASCAAALETYERHGLLPAEVKQSATFIRRINDMFDLMNSRSISDKGCKSPITGANLQERLKTLSELQEWVAKWRFEDEEGNSRSLPFQRGLQITLSAFQHVVKNLLNDHGFQYVLLHRFNQDCVENLFSLIRRDRGGFNDHPEAGRAVQGLRMISCEMLMETSSTGNCEPTDEPLFLSAGIFLLNTDNSTISLYLLC
jgi:hypothetical protein